ncbi:MAG: molybdopterin-dependent oxidoreductase [Dehalococcoidia bacterium]
MPDEITITVDGQEVRTTSDKMVLQAANDAGLYVPYLCYHPGMKPYGSCRMCVVEVEGQRGTPASCTLPVRDGMVVNTLNQDTKAVRDTTLELLISEHPHGCLTCHRIDLCGPQDVCLRHVDVTDRCVTCPKNERCELKDTTRYHEMPMVTSLDYQYRGLQVETKDPFYDRDYNLCIVCARCVRACDEIRGDVALTMTERAGQVLVGTVLGDSLLESGCEFCGACIDVCPVGALVESDYKWERPARTEQSVCGECAVGCNMTYEVNQWEKLIRVIPELNAPANHGQACFRGKFGFDYVNSKERIRHPLVRRNGSLEEATWEEALQAAADGLAPHKGAQFALIASPRNSNEELYAAQKFTRTVMQSNNVDVSSNDHFGMAEGLREVLGYAAGTMSNWDLRESSVVMVVSSNLTEEQNVLGVPIKQAVREGQQQLIVIDSREVELTRYARLWLRPLPGTDVAVLGGLLRYIVDNDLVDQEAVSAQCENWDALVTSLKPFTLEQVEKDTGVPAALLEQAARLYATGGTAALLLGLENCPTETLRAAAHAAAGLALVTGNIGREKAGIVPLYYGANGQGAWDMGAVPAWLPGQVPVEDAEARSRVAAAWGAEVPAGQGLLAAQAMEAARSGAVKAMLLMGDSSHYEDGAFGDTAAALENLSFLVVTDGFLSPIDEKADVVFPAAQWAEKQGTYTNIERRVQPLKRVLKNKRVDSRPDLDIVCGIAVRMNASGFEYAGPEAVLDEIASLTPSYAGISYQRLLANAFRPVKPAGDNPQPTQVMYSTEVLLGLQWPCVSPDDAGSPVLYAEDGYKARLREVSWGGQRVSANSDFPLLLAHGRVLVQAERETSVITKGKLNHLQREEALVLNPADAKKLRLSEGQGAEVTSASGLKRQGTVVLSDTVPVGVISLTTLFGEHATAIEEAGRADPMNHLPHLKVEPVSVSPV